MHAWLRPSPRRSTATRAGGRGRGRKMHRTCVVIGRLQYGAADFEGNTLPADDTPLRVWVGSGVVVPDAVRLRNRRPHRRSHLAADPLTATRRDVRHEQARCSHVDPSTVQFREPAIHRLVASTGLGAGTQQLAQKRVVAHDASPWPARTGWLVPRQTTLRCP
jgi:hypothetical protein